MRHILLLIMTLFAINSFGQHEEESHAEEVKNVIEIIGTGIYSESLNHSGGVGGTEFHLTNWFNHKWGSGLSYTLKFEEEETLHDIALLGSYNAARWMTLNVGPNFGLSNDHREFELGFYAESELNIRPSENFHFGPVVGTVLSENSELSFGVHLGYEFK